MLRKLQRAIDVYKSKKKIIKKAKKIGNNIVINDRVKINNNTYLGNNIGLNGLIIREKGKVSFGNNISIAKGCLILTGNHNYKGELLPYDYTDIYRDVIIEDNVWIGQNVTILGGVTIGEGAIIQAGSTVVSNIESLSIAGGAPAKVFNLRDKEEYEKMKNEKRFYKFIHKKKYTINPY